MSIVRRLYSTGRGSRENRVSNYTFVSSGHEEIDRFLTRLPEAFRKEALEMAIKPASDVVRDEAKNIVSKSVNRGTEQSKAAYISRNIKSVKSKSKRNPGYNIYVKGKDIPVGDREWHIQGYAVLLGEGSYKGERYTRKTKARRGKFRGIGNFIESAGSNKSATYRRMMMYNIESIYRSYARKGGNNSLMIYSTG